MKLFLVTFSLFVSFALWSQRESPLNRIAIESFGYPDFGGRSSYGDFLILYPIGESTSVGFRGLNQQNAIFGRFNLRAMARQRIAKNFFAEGGYEMEWDLTELDRSIDNTSKSLYFGVEYEAKPNLLFNAGFRTFMNETGFNPLGTERSDAKSQLQLGSKIKF
ncbi:hypothetical protein L0P88_17075 [Muricauda sp. SCSIO 64092]|uniref:hypothetical protein n=1 Tax=Allomuricauda sp. SCSIO 64092 TaxID=2908842 RepID=UPI001FF14B87|nr:hypothetical protein [Muricauda sp. SCSIO 64092]UOY05654.1 hypothetical protein L0P88_17075 [Muricauda sp. SCSIO 64092]